MSESAAPPVPATERAAALLETITTKILRPFEYTDIADLADARAAEHRARTVVVVGEVKRGKSFLVNALVGYRDASPVGVDVTTSTTLSFTDGDIETGSGLGGAGAELIYPDRSETVAHTELADWVSCEGARVRDVRATELPTRAVVSVPGSRMGATTVIDTPGVGGLDPSYAALAAAGLAQACVVVIVCDASTPLTAPEMEFITSAAAGVEALIVAVTKTDKNVRRWKPIVERNTAVLREHLGREIPVLGVSSLRAVVAAEMGPGPARESAEERSGITALRALIDAKLAVADQLPAAGGLRTAIGGLRTLAADLRVQISAITDADRLVPDLTAQLEELQELKDHAQQWEQYLHRDLTLIRQAATDELDRRLDEIREKCTTRIQQERHGSVAAQSAAFHRRDGARLPVGVGRVDGGVPLPAPYHHRRTAVRLRGGVGRHLHQGRGDFRRSRGRDPFGRRETPRVARSVDAHHGCNGLVDDRRHRRCLHHHRSGCGRRNRLGGSQSRIPGNARRQDELVDVDAGDHDSDENVAARMFEGALALARPDIVIRYREHLQSSTALLQKQIKDAEDSARSDSATREKKLARLENNLKVVNGNITRAEALIAELTAAPPPPGGVRTHSAGERR